VSAAATTTRRLGVRMKATIPSLVRTRSGSTGVFSALGRGTPCREITLLQRSGAGSSGGAASTGAAGAVVRPSGEPDGRREIHGRRRQEPASGGGGDCRGDRGGAGGHRGGGPPERPARLCRRRVGTG